MDRSILDWPTGVTIYKPEKCYSGYTLVSSHVSHIRPLFFGWNLIDMRGRIVKSWYSDSLNPHGYQLFERLVNGNYITMGLSITEQDWRSKIVWSYPFERGERPVSSFYHHDVQRLPDGNIIVMVREYVDDQEISKVKLQDDHLFEVTPDKRIVWDWWGHRHFEEFEFSEEAKKIVYETGGGTPPYDPWFHADWLHMNTISVLPQNRLCKDGDDRFKPGNLLLCSRNTNTIFIIEKKTGEIVWMWRRMDKMEGHSISRHASERNYLIGPHDPKMLDNGNIIVFDNGGSGGYPPIVRFFTRLVELDPAKEKIVWEYLHRPDPGHFFSPSMGSVHRLPNGNTVALDADSGRVFEVTPQGEIVWEFVNPGGSFYRTQRISYEDIPEADPHYMETDGHLGVVEAKITVPEYMGLPVEGGPDYCPRSY